jgi:hypothetical protein
MNSTVRAILIGLSVVLLTVPACGQGISRGGKGSRQQNDQQSAQKKKQADELDKAYRAGLDRIPNSTKKDDPWANMRGTGTTPQGAKSK